MNNIFKTWSISSFLFIITYLRLNFEWNTKGITKEPPLLPIQWVSFQVILSMGLFMGLDRWLLCRSLTFLWKLTSSHRFQGHLLDSNKNFYKIILTVASEAPKAKEQDQQSALELKLLDQLAVDRPERWLKRLVKSLCVLVSDHSYLKELPNT